MHPSLFATFSMDLVTISVLFVLLKSKCILEMFKYVLLGNIMPCADHRVGLQIRDVYNFWTSHLCRNLCSCQVPDRRHGWKMLIHITGLQQILPLPCLFLHHPPGCISHRVGYTVPLIWTISHIQPLPTGYTSVFWNRGQEAQINLSNSIPWSQHPQGILALVWDFLHSFCHSQEKNIEEGTRTCIH